MSIPLQLLTSGLKSSKNPQVFESYKIVIGKLKIWLLPVGNKWRVVLCKESCWKFRRVIKVATKCTSRKLHNHDFCR